MFVFGRVLVTLSLVGLCPFGGCIRPDAAPAQHELTRMKESVSRLHPGMGFGEVEQVVPIARADASGLQEHGGVWYNFHSGGRYYIQMRFSHPAVGESYKGSILNLPPRIRRETDGSLVN